MQIKIALVKNAISAGLGKLSILLFRILQVPLLLSGLGVDNYGRWLVISALSSWLTLANIGFGSVAANEISMAVASGEIDRARKVFSTAVFLVMTILLTGTIIISLVAPFIPWHEFIGLSSEFHTEIALTIIWFAVTVFMSFFASIIGGRFMAGRKQHVATSITGCRPWLDLVAIFVSLHFSKRFDYLAFSLFLSNTVYLIVYWINGYKAMPSLTFSTSKIDKGQFNALFKKGIAFQAFPLGNALMFQGNLLIIQAILGPASVALFGTARTMVRSVNQVLELINQIIWSEFTYLFGIGNLVKAARLHRISVVASIFAACLSVLVFTLFGSDLYAMWTNKAIILSNRLLFLFLLPIPFNAIWFTSSVVHMASNNHEGLALRYLFATIISTILCVLLTLWQDIDGAAVSTLVVDLIIIPYVIRTSMYLTNDNWVNFKLGIASEIRVSVRSARKRFNLY